MLISGKTDRGIVRSTNQDDFKIGNLPGGAVYAVVCDGMGGANGGNIASSTAVKTIEREIVAGFSEELVKSSDETAIKLLIDKAVKIANKEVYDLSCLETDLSGMGTTVVVCVCSPEFIVCANAGDSRAYLIGKCYEQITHDHSIVQEMVENGKITSDEALTHPQKNIITRALGVENDLELDFTKLAFQNGETLLICTDGLTNMVEDKTIEEVIRKEKPEICTEKLVELANQEGGNDNITVVIINNENNVVIGGEING